MLPATLHARLVLLTVIVLAPLVALMVFNTLEREAHLKEHIEHDVLYLARSAQMQQGQFFDHISTLTIAPHTVISVVDSSGTIQFHPTAPALVGQQTSDQAALTTALTESSGVIEATDAAGTPHIYGFAPYSNGTDNAYVIVRTPLSSVSAQVNALTARNLAILGTVTLIALALAWLSSSQLFLSPFQRLLDATQRLANGDLRTRTGLPHQDGEFGSLAATIDRMAEALQQREADLLQAHERLQAESAALRLSEERYQAISELVSDFAYAFRVEPDGSMTREWITDAVARIVGFSPQEVAAGFDWNELVHPDDKPAVALSIRRGLAGEPTITEFRIVTRQGSTRWLRSHARPEWDTAEGRVVRIYGAAQDITHQRQAEQQLYTTYQAQQELYQQVTRSRDLLRTLFDALDDGLLLLGQDGRVRAINRALASLLKVAPEESIDQDWDGMCQCSVPPFPGALALLTLSDGTPRTRRERITGPDGRVHILDMLTFALVGAEQQVEQVVLRVIDTTERLQLETMMMENERFVASGKLAATVAHEINTPLQAIRNFLFLADDDTDPERQNYLAFSRDEIDRIGTIVRQLLDFYRPSSGTIEPVDMNAVLNRVLILTDSTITRQGITVERDIDPDVPPLWGRADQLTQVILNLLVNALEAMPAGGTLRLATRTCTDNPDAAAAQLAPQEYIVVEIADSGPGISAEIQARIFEPFFTTRPDGTGLGLAISQTIVQQHQGQITVQSTPGQGSTFTLLLPVREDLDDLEYLDDLDDDDVSLEDMEDL